MTGYVLYHNPRCSKSLGALDLLQEKGIEPEIVRYLDEPLDARALRALVNKLGIRPRELLRTGEEEYRSLGLANDAMDDDAIIEAMAAHPRLIQRPILVRGDRAVIGRPPERILELLD